MATDLMVHGPIPIPFASQRTGSSKQIDREKVVLFLELIAGQGIAEKHGCYVFAMRAAKGFRPWYVGKTTKGMAKECMGLHQLRCYNEVLFKAHRGTPVMFFVAPSGGKKKVPRRVCDEVETQLIQSALAKNPELCNIKKTKVQEWTIKGVVRPSQGKRMPVERSFKTMMGL